MSDGSDDSDDDGDAHGGDGAHAAAPRAPQTLWRVCAPGQATVLCVYFAIWTSASCCGCVAGGAGSVFAADAGFVAEGGIHPAHHDAHNTCWLLSGCLRPL